MGSGVLRPDSRKTQGERSRFRRADILRVPSLGRHRYPLQRRAYPHHRTRIRGTLAEEDAARPSRARAGARSAAALSEGDRRGQRRRRARSRHRERRRQQQDSQGAGGTLRARHRAPYQQVRLARDAQDLRRIHLHLRRDREGLGPGPRVPFRRRHEHVHRGDDRRYLARARLRADDQGGVEPLPRESLRALPGRPGAHGQRRAT